MEKYNQQNVDQAAVIDSFEMTRIWKKSTLKLKVGTEAILMKWVMS